jgi:hypothetical protein
MKNFKYIKKNTYINKYTLYTLFFTYEGLSGKETNQYILKNKSSYEFINKTNDFLEPYMPLTIVFIGVVQLFSKIIIPVFGWFFNNKKVIRHHQQAVRFDNISSNGSDW